MTSVMPLISGPVPAAEPRGLLWVTSGSCSSAGRAFAASPPSTPVPSSPPAWRWKQTSRGQAPALPRPTTPLPKQDTVLPLGPGPSRSSLFQEVGCEGTRSQTLETSLSLSSQQYQRPNNFGGPGESRLYQVTALPLAGVDEVGDIPVDMESKAARWRRVLFSPGQDSSMKQDHST